MKFLTTDDVKLFLLEVGSVNKLNESLDTSYVPTNEEMTTFIKRRERDSNTLKDKEKSRNAKSNWRANRANMMRGIRAYHKSTEGKRFHKRLGRFLATRMTREKGKLSIEETIDFLKGINTAKNTLITEMEYYHTLTEQVELENLVLNFTLPMVNSLERSIIECRSLTEDELDFLIAITETSALVKSLSDKTSRSEETIDGYWKDIKKALIRDGHDEADKKFYGLLVSILKKKLNID